MKFCDHRDDGEAVVVVLVAAEPPRLSLDERKERDRVTGVDPSERFAVARRDRGDDERQPALAEREGGVERASKAVERDVVRIAEPGLVTEVVDGGEAAPARAV